MKKIIFLISCVFFLGSCSIPFIWGWNDDTQWDTEETSSATTEFKNDVITMLIPTSWQEIATSNLPVPKSGEIKLALKSQDKTDGLYRTLVILQDELLWTISSEQYARNDYKISIKKYSSFKELSEKSINFDDGTNSKLYIFEAKYNPDSPTIKFIQSSKVCSKNERNYVYNITIALPSSIDELEKFEWLVKTLTCN
jgi:hypothetical protein